MAVPGVFGLFALIHINPAGTEILLFGLIPELSGCLDGLRVHMLILSMLLPVPVPVVNAAEYFPFQPFMAGKAAAHRKYGFCVFIYIIGGFKAV